VLALAVDFVVVNEAQRSAEGPQDGSCLGLEGSI